MLTSPIATLRGESKNQGFTLFSIAWSLALAWLASFTFYQAARVRLRLATVGCKRCLIYWQIPPPSDPSLKPTLLSILWMRDEEFGSVPKGTYFKDDRPDFSSFPRGRESRRLVIGCPKTSAKPVLSDSRRVAGYAPRFALI